MKNKKTILGSAAAITASVALIAGGTFAAWSDFSMVEDNQLNAGHLVLDVNGSAPVANPLSLPIAPGEYRTIDFFVASADLAGVPTADLTFSVKELVDLENGCSSNSEVAVDSQCSTHETEGEFSDESYVVVRWSDPVADAAYVGGGQPCQDPDGNSIPVGTNNGGPGISLADLEDADWSLGTLQGGEGVCLRLDIGLPVGATNASQGDTSEFDLQFDLTQS